ncbi:hypothetical protein EYF80_003281 [Liparis tanakae]|uniref:Uncharacterized protein n=1 Tax=Liparis tanakae TaxID=230148 RepID=A0A4Z2J9B3_9TELE|nr:hypothetical protein EYF80_003281 [Liparis tanakae]
MAEQRARQGDWHAETKQSPSHRLTPTDLLKGDRSHRIDSTDEGLGVLSLLRLLYLRDLQGETEDNASVLDERASESGCVRGFCDMGDAHTYITDSCSKPSWIDALLFSYLKPCCTSEEKEEEEEEEITEVSSNLYVVHGCAATPGAARLPHIWRNEFDPLKGHRKLPLKAANKSSSGEQEPRAPFIAANDLFIKSDDG